MIIELIVNAILGLVNMVLNLIPDIGLNVDIGAHFSVVGEFFRSIDMFVSIPVIIFCITSSIIVDNFGFIVKIINFIWSKIPFIS